MAITKERLEELIQQNASIYYIEKTWINPNIKYVNSILLNNKNHRVGYFSYDFSLPEQENMCLRECFAENSTDIAILKDIYEDLETATFCAKFKGVPRIEYLDIPTWEEVENMNKFIVCEIDDWYRLMVYFPQEIDENGFIGIDAGGNCEIYHWDGATKENYLEACEQFVKIFKGERDD